MNRTGRLFAAMPRRERRPFRLVGFAAVLLVACGERPGDLRVVEATVEGLDGSGSGLVLDVNGNETLVRADGVVTLANMPSGTSYTVSVKRDPGGPAQRCDVQNGTGKAGVGAAEIIVTCVTTYGLGGSVIGLASAGLVLQSGVGEELSVTKNGSFFFAERYPSGSAYSVTVLSQPARPSQTCTVQRGGGEMRQADVSDVLVSCVDSPACGDGYVDKNESCDDGAMNGNTSCDTYGGTCACCTVDCKGATVQGPHCGDGIVNGAEVCDDGASNGGTACPYGTPSCQICNSTCTGKATRIGPYCGDGTVNGTEECDNSASMACGTCSDACTDVAIAAARGTITILAIPADGDWFSLDAGKKSAVVTFEFDTSGGCAAGNQCIDIAGVTDLDSIAALVASRIRNASIGIDATANADELNLENTNSAGHTGNAAIEIYSPSGALSATGMTGGAGCPVREYCERYRNSDCLSNVCEDQYSALGDYAYSLCKSH